MHNASGIRFSMVIPAYNEELFLPRLLDSIEVARSAYRGGSEAVEVIVADNASTDDTERVARRFGCRVVRVEKRVIAAARNGGARAALGEVLCFIDADSEIHPETFNAIDDALATGRVIAGATGVRPERWSFGIFVTYCLLVPFAWLLNMDSGVVFCRREDFEAVGGYDESRLYAEDVAFLFALRRRGRVRGQRLKRLKGVKALGATRKFDQFGDWHYFTLAARVFWGWLKGEYRDKELAESYWYKPKR
ncbi:MAG: glycosyltransferase [Acidobacteriota bacterium]|nr:glycosyltransferase [Acidobacteriota bacterium]